MKLLKAQLDSEKYERGFLEVQVKQYEERLSKFGECDPLVDLIVSLFDIFFYSERPEELPTRNKWIEE